jgi:hypothetical protein
MRDSEKTKAEGSNYFVAVVSVFLDFFIFLALVVFVEVLSWAKTAAVAPKKSERPSIRVMSFFIGVVS